MRLLATHTSPFARKVLIVAHELGLADDITFVLVDTASVELGRENPLNKVPALVLDDGSSLFDSPVICEFLDSHRPSAVRALFPPGGPARWHALRQQALADGLCDAAVLIMLEGRKPAALQSAEWVAKQKRKVTQALAELERDPPPAPLDIGGVATLAALGYLDFRFPNENWREESPRLAAWFGRESDRESFRLTAPRT